MSQSQHRSSTLVNLADLARSEIHNSTRNFGKPEAAQSSKINNHWQNSNKNNKQQTNKKKQSNIDPANARRKSTSSIASSLNDSNQEFGDDGVESSQEYDDMNHYIHSNGQEEYGEEYDGHEEMNDAEEEDGDFNEEDSGRSKRRLLSNNETKTYNSDITYSNLKHHSKPPKGRKSASSTPRTTNKGANGTRNTANKPPQNRYQSMLFNKVEEILSTIPSTPGQVVRYLELSINQFFYYFYC